MLIEKSDLNLLQTLERKKKEFEELQEEQVHGIIVRTRAKWVAERERNSKYFFNLEKRNFQRKCIMKLQTEDGLVTDMNKILEKERLFYGKLY